jgi:hypothetical protein
MAPEILTRSGHGKVSLQSRIRIQLFSSLRIRIQVAKSTWIHPDPDPVQTLLSKTYLRILFERIIFSNFLKLLRCHTYLGIGIGILKNVLLT